MSVCFVTKYFLSPDKYVSNDSMFVVPILVICSKAWLIVIIEDSYTAFVFSIHIHSESVALLILLAAMLPRDVLMLVRD